eukprot:TRINITY_DN3771_c0_g3_i1.p1 TRINITY_DN3771_c0_g3~~TRINITY_DN3771_c0_g3_i1.p1  ORF type:complete len:349 (-),score=23.88 TRINITY_DN3771_c0_g3_i1:153-1109(-)
MSNRFMYYVLLLLAFVQAKPLPIVLWHGMGDSCCNPDSMGRIKKFLQEKLDGVYVYSINSGQSTGIIGYLSDTISGYLGNVNSQVEKVCEELQGIPELQHGYNAIGFSQGGQFLRAVVERCQHRGPKMHTLVTMGGQHQGVMNIPGCEAVVNDPNTQSSSGSGYLCKTMQYLLGLGAYLSFVQDSSVQAQYFKDPVEFSAYQANSIFLADINNDRTDKNETYAGNLASLEKFVMVMFLNDTMVVPKESSWFGYYNGSNLLSMFEQAIYEEDWIGLKQLNDKQALVFINKLGDHLQFSLDWFDQYIIQPYLLDQSYEVV